MFQKNSREKGVSSYRGVVLIEGIVLAVPGVLTSKSFFHPLVLMVLGIYTAWRVGRVRQMSFFLGLCLGVIASAAATFGGGITVSLYGFFAPPLVAFSVLVAYYLFSGTHFFATYYRSPAAWVTTVIWALLIGLLVRLTGAASVVIIIVPMLWLCFLPLWTAELRLLHSLAFVLVYLGMVYLPGPIGNGMDLPGTQWPTWFGVLGLSLVPELLGYFYPERKHPLDCLPVITPTLNWSQKMKAWREVFFLVSDFYALTMEKYPWFSRLAPLGRYLILIGTVGEILASILGFSLWIRWPTGLAAVTGMVMELGIGNYVPMILGLAGYGAAMVLCRGFLSCGIHYPALVAGAGLLVLAYLLWQGRPRETRADLQKWKELNS